MRDLPEDQKTEFSSDYFTETLLFFTSLRFVITIN